MSNKIDQLQAKITNLERMLHALQKTRADSRLGFLRDKQKWKVSRDEMEDKMNTLKKENETLREQEKQHLEDRKEDKSELQRLRRRIDDMHEDCMDMEGYLRFAQRLVHESDRKERNRAVSQNPSKTHKRPRPTVPNEEIPKPRQSFKPANNAKAQETKDADKRPPVRAQDTPTTNDDVDSSHAPLVEEHDNTRVLYRSPPYDYDDRTPDYEHSGPEEVFEDSVRCS